MRFAEPCAERVRDARGTLHRLRGGRAMSDAYIGRAARNVRSVDRTLPAGEDEEVVDETAEKSPEEGTHNWTPDPILAMMQVSLVS